MRATEYLDLVSNGFDADRELRMSHFDSNTEKNREIITLKRRELKKHNKGITYGRAIVRRGIA